MKKLIFPVISMLFLTSCGPKKYGIRTEVNPKEHVHVFLSPKLIITGFQHEQSTKTVEEVNNEHTVFDFYLPSGEQNIYIRALYTRGIYAFHSSSRGVKINAEKGDSVLVCGSIREIGERRPTGGSVDVIVEPKVKYFKTDEEKEKAYSKEKINEKFLNDTCNSLLEEN